MSPAWKAYLALFTVYVIWGTTLGSIAVGTETIPTMLLPCLRFLLAGALLVAFCRLRGEPWPSIAELKTHFWVGLLLFVGGNTIVAWTVQHISTGLAGLLVATTPFCMVGLSAILPPREKVPPSALVGIGIGFMGMMILLWPQLSHPVETGWVFWLAVLSMLATSMFWSLGSILARTRPTHSSLLMSVGMQNLLAGMTLTPVGLALTPDWTFEPSVRSVLAMVYLILFGTIVATPCYLYVLKNLSVSLSSTFAYVTPVITVLVGALFLGESVDLLTIIGAAVILCGVVVVQLGHTARPLPPEKEISLESAVEAPVLRPAWKGAFFK